MLKTDNPYLVKGWISIVLMLCVVMSHCGRSLQDNQRTQRSSEQKSPSFFPETIPPNHCRIVGTILSIAGTLKTAQADDPLSKVPCLAVVRIDSILGYGSAFTNPLAVGNEISVLFQFTLNPTKDIFPTLQQHYPGLTVGSVFRTDLEEVMADEQQKKTLQYSHIIYGYQFIKR
jgi:hypothetical protein